MTASKDDPQLKTILAELRWHVRPERFVLVGLQSRERQLAVRLLPADLSPFTQLIVEPGMVTMFLPETDWRGIRPAFPQARVQHPFRLLSFDADLPDTLVGFLATVSTALAAEQIPILAICGFSRDHIVIRENDLDRTVAALTQLVQTHRTSFES